MSIKDGASARQVLALALTALGLGIGGVAWAAVSGFKASEAYTLAKTDHDVVTRLSVVVDRLERAADKIEKK